MTSSRLERSKAYLKVRLRRPMPKASLRIIFARTRAPELKFRLLAVVAVHTHILAYGANGEQMSVNQHRDLDEEQN